MKKLTIISLFIIYFGIVFTAQAGFTDWLYNLYLEDEQQNEEKFGAGVYSVVQGGTGAQNFTSGECLVGAGTGAVTTTACGGGTSFGQAWEISSSLLAPTTSIVTLLDGGFISNASSTFSSTANFTGLLTATTLAFPNDSVAEADILFSTACAAGNHYYLNGNDLACEADDNTLYSAGSGLQLIGTVFSFDSTSANTWTALQTFGNASATQLTATRLYNTYASTTQLTVSANAEIDGFLSITSADDGYIYFDADAEYLLWDDGGATFYISDGLTLADDFIVNGTGTSTFAGGIQTKTLDVTNLVSCDTIDTDANGVFTCGTDDDTIGGAGGVGTISTSTTPTHGQLPYWTSTGAYPETLGTIATTTLTATSPLTLSNAISVIGGSASVLTVDLSDYNLQAFASSTYMLMSTTTLPLVTTMSGLVNATTTNFDITNALSISGDYITDFNGAGLDVTAGVLTLDATGDWTGIFDGQDGSYYLDMDNFTNTGTSTLPQLSITESQISDLDHYTDADVSTYLTGGTGITESSGTLSFDCSEVEGTGIDCATEAITLNATGDWTGTFDGLEGGAYSNHIFASSTYMRMSTTTLPLVTTMAGLTTVGTIGAGTWQSTDVGVAYGGTGVSTLSAGELLVGAGASAITSTTTANLKNSLHLGSVENTALSTWAGSTNILTVGTVGTGAWAGDVVAMAYGGTNKNMTASNGALAYSDADSLELLSAGTNGNILTMSGGLPVWVASTTMVLAGNITGTLGATVIASDVITPDMVLSAGQVDETCLTYEATGDTWAWQTCGSASGSSGWATTTNGADILLYPDDSSVDILFGATASSSAPFWFDVSATSTYIGNGGTGDSSMQFGPDADAWIMGFDITDKSFTLSSSTALGTTNVFAIAKATLLTTYNYAATFVGNVITAILTITGTLVVPQSTTCDSNANGELCHDTTDNQLILDGNVVQTQGIKIWGRTIASTSPAFIDGGLMPLTNHLDGFTITRIQCYVVGGTSKIIAIEDAGTASSEDITCAVTNTTDDNSITNATYTASELANIDFGATTGAVNYVSISVFGTWGRD